METDAKFCSNYCYAKIIKKNNKSGEKKDRRRLPLFKCKYNCPHNPFLHNSTKFIIKKNKED